MIIWINGAYGAGKTTIAELLHSEIAGSYLYDPENIGDFLRDNLPKQLQKADFQDHSEWRAWNVHILKKLNKEYPGDIIVPMTVYKKTVVDELFTGLRQANLKVYHFQLEVSKETLLERLQERSPALITWETERVDEIIEAFQGIPETEKIENDRSSPNEVVQIIMAKIH